MLRKKCGVSHIFFLYSRLGFVNFKDKIILKIVHIKDRKISYLVLNDLVGAKGEIFLIDLFCESGFMIATKVCESDLFCS